MAVPLYKLIPHGIIALAILFCGVQAWLASAYNAKMEKVRSEVLEETGIFPAFVAQSDNQLTEKIARIKKTWRQVYTEPNGPHSEAIAVLDEPATPQTIYSIYSYEPQNYHWFNPAANKRNAQWVIIFGMLASTTIDGKFFHDPTWQYGLVNARKNIVIIFEEQEGTLIESMYVNDLNDATDDDEEPADKTPAPPAPLSPESK